MGRGLSTEQRQVLQILAEYNADREEKRWQGLDGSVVRNSEQIKKFDERLAFVVKVTPGKQYVLWGVPMPPLYDTEEEKAADIQSLVERRQGYINGYERALFPKEWEAHDVTYSFILHKLHPELELRDKYTDSFWRDCISWDRKVFKDCEELKSLQASLRRTVQRLEKRGLVTRTRDGWVAITAEGLTVTNKEGAAERLPSLGSVTDLFSVMDTLLGSMEPAPSALMA